MILRALDLPTLRGFLWAGRALRVVHDDLRANGLEYAPAPAPPRLPERAYRGVLAKLRRQESTCLERALVLQQWHSSRGEARDVIIAVQGPSVDFAAHAWLDGEPDGETDRFQELMRLSPR